MNHLNILDFGESGSSLVEGWGKTPSSELRFQNQYHHEYSKHMLTTLIICFVTLYIKYFIYMSLLNRDYSHSWSEEITKHHCIITGIFVLRTHTCTNFMFVFHCNPVFSFVWLHARSSSLVPTVCLIEYAFALWLLFFVLMNFLQVVNI